MSQAFVTSENPFKTSPKREHNFKDLYGRILDLESLVAELSSLKHVCEVLKRQVEFLRMKDAPGEWIKTSEVLARYPWLSRAILNQATADGRIQSFGNGVSYYSTEQLVAFSLEYMQRGEG